MIFYPDSPRPPEDDSVDETCSGDIHKPRPTLYTLTALEGSKPTPEEWRLAKHMAVANHALGGLIAALQRGWGPRSN